MTATATNLNQEIYRKLLVRTLPRVIRTKEEYEHFAAELMRLDEVDEPAPEEAGMAELLTVLIEKYEEKQFPVRKGSPQQVLRHLMDARGLAQRDMLKIFGSKGITSEVLNGKRSISKSQAKKLAQFFRVGVELFI